MHCLTISLLNMKKDIDGIHCIENVISYINYFLCTKLVVKEVIMTMVQKMNKTYGNMLRLQIL